MNKVDILNFSLGLWKLLFFPFFIFAAVIVTSHSAVATEKYVIHENYPMTISADTWDVPPAGGDTIYISHLRKKAIKFRYLSGDEGNPLVVINSGGQVNIEDTTAWGAITFENCTHIKITGTGSSEYKYGFKLSASSCGLAFSELSSDCEAEFIEIDHDGFFGIYAKKDYGGNPPIPAPVFSNLLIHDCFIQNVTEGMYLGETKSPGMEFRHVKIFNNIVTNTGREAIQIANMVEDVEIFNNTLLHAGADGESYQSNLLQIGDNSVARVYNNILIGAPAYGIISLGMGHNYFENNYFGNNKGIFTDNRLFSEPGSPVVINKNYFTGMTSSEVIKNMNELNIFSISGNNWDTEIPLYKNASGNDSNYLITENNLVPVVAITFTNPEENNFSLSPGTPECYMNLGAPGGPVFFDPEPVTPVQLILTPDMIVDEVAGGSYWPASYLIDEQYCTPDNGFHPVSQSWKPFYNMSKAPYHMYIDLKEVHHITKIALHDMNNTKNIEVSAGEPGNWKHLFTEPLDKYKVWKLHTTDTDTRFIRISMTESVYAAINELVIYGYPKSSVSGQKSGLIQQVRSEEFNILDHAKAELHLAYNQRNHLIQMHLPKKYTGDFRIDLMDIQGRIFSSEDYRNYQSNHLEINLNSFNMITGIYLLRYSKKEGMKQTIKFTNIND